MSLICSIMISFMQSGFAQVLPPLIQPGWERIYIKNTGYFHLPPTMEIQKGKYKEYVDEYKKIRGYETSHITAQPKGLNELHEEGIEKYARIMFNTTYGKPGDYLDLDFDFSDITQEEINELSSIFKEQIIKEFEGTSLKLVEWYPIKFEKINGMSCIHVRYKRKVNDGPHVWVDMYNFQNHDRIHRLTLSYRISEESTWKEDLQKVLKSFRITNIKH